MAKFKKPNLEKWRIFSEKWVETGGLITPKEVSSLLNVSESHVSRHAAEMELEKEGKYITFRSLMKVINKRSELKDEKNAQSLRS